MSPARFLRSELGMLFRRRRNIALLVILALVPVLISVAVRASGENRRNGSIFGGITDNGLFAALAAFLVITPFFLGSVAGAVASGRVPAGIARAHPVRSFVNPTSMLGGALAVVVCAYLAAVYLACSGLTQTSSRRWSTRVGACTLDSTGRASICLFWTSSWRASDGLADRRK